MESMKQEEVLTSNLSEKGAMKKASAFFFLLMLLEIPMSFLVGFLQNIFREDYSILISVLVMQGYLLLGALIYLLITKKGFVKDLQVRKYKVSTFFLSLLLLITAAPMASLLNVISQLFVKNTASTAILSITKTVPMWLGILIVGCLPGFIEETLYRGIFFTTFKKRSVLTGIIISALSFGLMHMNFNQILYAIYLGIIFALVVEATGSLVSTMILHMLFNAINTSYMYILPKLYEWLGRYSKGYASFDIETAMSQTPSTMQIAAMAVLLLPMAIGGVVLTILLLKAIAKINGRTFTWASIMEKKSGMEQTNPLNVFLILGWMYCLVTAIANMLM